jgi:hypothetical protein
MISPVSKNPRTDPLELEKEATLDHVIPRSKKGSNDITNTVICCQRCNGLKGNISYEIFVEFARTVIKPYPDVPTPVLRSSLRVFIETLAEIAIQNRRETNKALSISLLYLSEYVKKN